MIEADAEELERVAAEQAALRRVATLVARARTERELAAAVTSEIGQLFGAQRANTMRWDGDTIRVIGDWCVDPEQTARRRPGLSASAATRSPRASSKSARPGRLDSPADCAPSSRSERWAELGFHAAIGAPIVVDGEIWGVVIAFADASRTIPFPPGAEQRLGTSPRSSRRRSSNAEARREAAELVEEQSALRRIATLVAAGRPQARGARRGTPEVGAAVRRDARQPRPLGGRAGRGRRGRGWSDGSDAAAASRGRSTTRPRAARR